MPRISFRCLAAAVLAVCPAHAFAQSAADSGPSVTVGGYLILRELYADHVLTATASRARLAVEGRISGPFSYRVQAAFEPDAGTILRDAWIRWSHRGWTVTAGQFKTPFAFEYVTSLLNLETADRSAVVTALAPKRDLGVMGEYALGTRGSLSVALVNGEGQNAALNADSTLLVVSRLVARPIPDVALGADLAYYGADSLRVALDANVTHAVWTFRAAYLARHIANQTSNDYGWYLTGACRVRPGLELVAREDDYYQSQVLRGRRTLTTTAGANIRLHADRLRLVVDVVSRDVGAPGTRSNNAVADLQLRF